MKEALLKASNLKKYYYIQKNFFSRERIEIRAVDDLDFSLESSQTLAIVGESGCGKTSVAKLILKLIPATSGDIIFGSQIKNLRKDVQMVFQNPYNSLNPLMRIEDIILEPLLIHKMSSHKSPKERVIELLDLVDIDSGSRFRFPKEFSGGQRQRISLARALASGPKIIVLDEPVSSLDVRIQVKILNLLKSLQTKLSLSFLFITHNLAVVKNFSDACLVMYLGKIMEKAQALDIFKRSLHPYTESLLLAARDKRSKLKGDIPRFRKISGCIFNSRCPYAKDKCFSVEPKLEEKEKGHFSACHFSFDLYRSQK
ncbi:MAG: ATP-binding cassette domain-containing protein [Candidatus Omnitrophica bacterium]|nr:ATP-binding cassette domain-containing protein [Candidatus Omnitrophota bacterium]